MNQPNLTIIPLKAVVMSDRTTNLDLLIKISSPPLVDKVERSPLNIGLAIDRSGSMAGNKIEYARQAAIYAVEQLLPTDRVSVTIYDEEIQVLVPSTLAENKADICRKIKTIQSRGMTALHAGWLESGVEVSKYSAPNQIDRVLLLSDGLANVGETNPDMIAGDVHGLAKRGVNTSTMGVGDDYNEDLMEAIARSGDGNYYYIEDPEQLPKFFAAELQGLLALYGQKVSLGIRSNNGVVVTDIFNDLDKTTADNYKLANLIYGNSISCAIRLKIPPMQTSIELCSVRLAWDEPGKSQRQSMVVKLQLPVVTGEEFDLISPHPDVQEIVAILMTARAKTEVINHLDRGDYQSARAGIAYARSYSKTLRCSSPLMLFEDLGGVDEELDEAEKELETGDISKMRKKMSSQNFLRRRQ
jgi:Ca-activated chloride channel homolog